MCLLTYYIGIFLEYLLLTWPNFLLYCSSDLLVYYPSYWPRPEALRRIYIHWSTSVNNYNLGHGSLRITRIDGLIITRPFKFLALLMV